MSLISIAVQIASLLAGGVAVPATEATTPMVRIAEIEVDPTQLEAYKAILAEEQEASVRLEPGVLMLHSVAYKDAPTHIRLLEVYASKAAYEAHIRAPHFIKYKTSTEKMVTSLRLIETTPILLCAKSNGRDGGQTICLKR
ncbi:putative quinol monooxygenase [Sphingomonas pituitosa]|uniref:putative quinol monooxygenase n=1 Tax=Sphingomonas pituitosa TaxID=99597 RepID=UPI00082E63CA|nr:putative quinol monooxygenase [Sphingomonas pituitosa]